MLFLKQGCLARLVFRAETRDFDSFPEVGVHWLSFDLISLHRNNIVGPHVYTSMPCLELFAWDQLSASVIVVGLCVCSPPIHSITVGRGHTFWSSTKPVTYTFGLSATPPLRPVGGCMCTRCTDCRRHA